ncbi:DEAH-box ATP-dependent RNA helicase prp43 [Entomophthora muscae]|uniref:DEAH-box ATP-dependent RNA helicase prp43 n=1 Tax=Entomophthora muscae TaxID=34485 RepID=A0ACC2RT81_9FUNG|nr:DEAH-box ATP-dependent RNA helicase prp43 [Entomophthora muscae]
MSKRGFHDQNPYSNTKKDKTSSDSSMSTTNNPYLDHLNVNGSKKNGPLSGFVSGKTTAEQAIEVEGGDINPFTKKPFSQAYRKNPYQAQGIACSKATTRVFGPHSQQSECGFGWRNRVRKNYSDPSVYAI